MTEIAARFAAFITQCVEALELPAPEITENRFMFKVDDRWVELKYDPKDDRVTFATIAFMRAPDGAVRADLLASFNVYNLFNGGYALVNPNGDGIVYLCQPHRLAALSAREIQRFSARSLLGRMRPEPGI